MAGFFIFLGLAGIWNSGIFLLASGRLAESFTEKGEYVWPQQKRILIIAGISFVVFALMMVFGIVLYE